MANADVAAKARLQSRLEHPSRLVGSVTAGCHQPLLHGRAQFEGAAMTLVHQRSLALCPYPLGESVGGTPTDRQYSGRGRLAPGLPSQHTCHHVGFRLSSLCLLHCYLRSLSLMGSLEPPLVCLRVDVSAVGPGFYCPMGTEVAGLGVGTNLHRCPSQCSRKVSWGRFKVGWVPFVER